MRPQPDAIERRVGADGGRQQQYIVVLYIVALPSLLRALAEPSSPSSDDPRLPVGAMPCISSRAGG